MKKAKAKPTRKQLEEAGEHRAGNSKYAQKKTAQHRGDYSENSPYQMQESTADQQDSQQHLTSGAQK